MGAAIAAHLAAAGCRTFLLDLPAKGVEKGQPAARRNAISLAALKALPKARPPALMSPAVLERLQAGNFEDDLDRAARESDLVIEAVVERLDVKTELFARLAQAAGPECILATNTSGIPIGAIAQGIPEAFRRRVVGLHFFNPPRWMHLLEVIPSDSTDPAVVEEVSEFADVALGKGVVLCRDTPNFIGNRIGIVEMLLTFRAAERQGLTVEEVDFLNGPLLGRPKTGSFRLGDLVGIDVLGHVVQNLTRTLSADPEASNFDPLHELLQVPEVIQKLITDKRLGDKTGAGFYKKTKGAGGKSALLALDLNTLEYRAPVEPSFPELAALLKEPSLRKRVPLALQTPGRGGDFLRAVLLPLMNYSAFLAGVICDTPEQIDEAMRWGYGWQLGPFELLDAARPAWVVKELEKLGFTPAPLLQKVAASTEGTFYSADARKVWGLSGPVERTVRPGVLLLDRLPAAAVLEQNPSARLLDLDDGIACLEFRSKANVLDDGVVAMIARAPELLAAKGFRGLVIGNQAEHFCRGANLAYIASKIAEKNWAAVEQAVRELQDAFMNLRHGPLPVVAAPLGQTLGGGTELCLHAAHVQAGADLFLGLVEVGVGVLPAGGGLKEIARRGAAWARQVPGADPYLFVRRGFEAVATAKVSGSAFEARENGFLTTEDGITFHPKRVLADAKRRALALATAGWTPPDRNEPIEVIGRAGGANMLLGLEQFVWGGYASEYDKHIGQKVVHVLTGGMAPPGTQATAQTLLDLEREAFVSLSGEEKTFARIRYMLENKRPLRN